MGRTVAYIRVSTEKQETDNQKLEILSYAQERNMRIDQFLELKISSQRSQKARQIQMLLDQVEAGDILIISELSRLGRSTGEIIDLVNRFLEKGVRLIALKQSLDFTQHNMMTKTMVTMFGLFAELERDLIIDRTKKGLARAREAGKILGRPKGSLGKSKLDPYQGDILKLVMAGISDRAITRWLQTHRSLKVTPKTLRMYRRRRNIDGDVEQAKI